ncbi:MAG: hypothetical protein HYT42_00095, partial [Candidatus Sungbacteria bacterium]|nr:hypothetical protein [Candidatus Sungbacteria bacterium]
VLAMFRLAFRQPLAFRRWSFRVALACFGAAAWIIVGLLAFRLGFSPVLESLEMFLKAPIGAYYFTIFFGWIEFLQQSALLSLFFSSLIVGGVYFLLQSRNTLRG